MRPVQTAACAEQIGAVPARKGNPHRDRTRSSRTSVDPGPLGGYRGRRVGVGGGEGPRSTRCRQCGSLMINNLAQVALFL
jgi:hypothetical protein